jgi:uncharacterized protein (TIGR02757 family)
MSLKTTLEEEYKKHNNKYEVSKEKLDPILVARERKDEYISLICSLFAYGNVASIVGFLQSLDFSFDEAVKDRYYRFQNKKDVQEIFITMKKLKDIDSIEAIFNRGYKKEHSVLDGLYELISIIRSVNDYDSRGYRFLIGKLPTKKLIGESAYKRWNMYFRWMIRDDNIDFGLWSSVDTKDLIIPLDVHTFNVSRKLGLLSRKRYDLYSAVLLTEELKKFDEMDPVKYDFALYRIGQNKKFIDID